jgi:hypothetical protein
MATDTFSPQAQREFMAALNEFLQQLHNQGIRFSVQVEDKGNVELAPSEVILCADNRQAWLCQRQGQ